MGVLVIVSSHSSTKNILARNMESLYLVSVSVMLISA